MSAPARCYRFATRAHWSRCLISRFDVARDGSLVAIPKLGVRPRQLSERGPVTHVALDPYGVPMWRVGLPGALLRLADDGTVLPPFEAGAPLSSSPRWVIGRQGLWAFDPAGLVVGRYERDTLQQDLVVRVGDLALSIRGPLELLDIASHGHEGLWLLLRDGEGRSWAARLDCNGRPREVIAAPPEAGRPSQLGTAARGSRLVLMTSGETQLVFVDAADGFVRREMPIGGPNAPWRGVRLTTDARNRVAVLCRHHADPSRWTVFVLNAEGDTIDAVTGPLDPLQDAPHDLAVGAAVLWLAADDGLWRLDATEQSRAVASDSTLLTPALYSPDSDAGRGWLRAEIDVELPVGAALEVHYATTGDDRTAAAAMALAGDQSLSAEPRQEAMWASLDLETSRPFVVTEPHLSGQPISIPLFESDQRWLWLRVTLVTPPGVPPPPIRELRVLYPDASLVRHLPSIFRGRQFDPTGTVRGIVGVLETTTDGIDGRIRSSAAHVDAHAAPVEWLDFLARWLDVPWDDALPEDAKRRILERAGLLLARRGTRRGLEELLRALVGDAASARVVDLTVDHPPLRLGGRGCAGAALPTLLAGAPRSTATLGAKAVLGRACLGAPADPLGALRPELRIEITASSGTERALEPLLARVLAPYIPAGLGLRVAWRVTSALLAGADDVLDAGGPGVLGRDSEIGRTVLGGRGAGRIDDAGLDVGFRL